MADMTSYIGFYALPRLTPPIPAANWSHSMRDVTILFLEDTFPSTAVCPLEVFRYAGMLWNTLTGKRSDPRFRVSTASVTGRAVRCDGPIRIRPEFALKDVRN